MVGAWWETRVVRGRGGALVAAATVTLVLAQAAPVSADTPPANPLLKIASVEVSPTFVGQGLNFATEQRVKLVIDHASGVRLAERPNAQIRFVNNRTCALGSNEALCVDVFDVNSLDARDTKVTQLSPTRNVVTWTAGGLADSHEPGTYRLSYITFEFLMHGCVAEQPQAWCLYSAATAGSPYGHYEQVAKPSAPDITLSARTRCPLVWIFGVRGSGEKDADFFGYGRTVFEVIQQAKLVMPSGQVGRSAISYPAVPVGYGKILYPVKYNASVAAGKVALEAAIDRFTSGTCGRISQIAIVGYSQGAHVAGDVYQAHLTSAQRERVVALVLIGDPRFKGSAASPPNFGDFSARLNGVFDITGAPRVFTSAQYSRVRSYCGLGDPVCNFSPANVAACKASGPTCVHSNYFGRRFGSLPYTGWAGVFIGKKADTF